MKTTTTPPVSKPLRTYRRAVVLCFVIQGMAFATWASRIPQIQEAHQLSDGSWGTVLFALPLGLLSGIPLSGWAVTRFGSKPVLVLAALAHIGLLPAISLAQTVWQLVAVLFSFGFSANLLNIAVNTQAVGVEKLYQRSIMASFHGMWSLAGFAAAALGALFVSLDVSPLYHFSAMLVLLLALTLIAQRRLLQEDKVAAGHQKIFVKPDRTLLLLGLIALCSMLCEGTMFDWSGIYFKKVVQPPEALVALGYVAFMAAMAGARFVGDYVARRWGTRKIIQINGLLIASGLLVSVAFPFIPSALAGFILIGIGVSTVVPLVYSMAAQTETMGSGMAITAVSTIGFTGFLLGPPLIGYISEWLSLRWAFGLVALLGLVMSMLIRQVRFSDR